MALTINIVPHHIPSPSTQSTFVAQFLAAAVSSPSLGHSSNQLLGVASFRREEKLAAAAAPAGLPLVRNLPFLDPELHIYFAALARTYGLVLKLQLGKKLGVVVTSSATAREVLKDNDIIFANRDVPIAGRIASYGGSDIVWTPYGPKWRMLRKVCVPRMLSNHTLDSVYELQRREVWKTMGYFRSRAGSPVNVGEQMFLTVLNVITSMLWGGTVQGEESDSLGADFRQVVSDMTELLGKPNILDFYPGLAQFDLQGIEKQMKGLPKRFDGIFERMIEQRLKMERDGGSECRDFSQFLLKLKDEEDAKTPPTMTGLKALLMIISKFELGSSSGLRIETGQPTTGRRRGVGASGAVARRRERQRSRRDRLSSQWQVHK